jgi:hypothetical protein
MGEFGHSFAIDGKPSRFNEGEFKIQLNYKKWSW